MALNRNMGLCVQVFRQFKGNRALLLASARSLELQFYIIQKAFVSILWGEVLEPRVGKSCSLYQSLQDRHVKNAHAALSTVSRCNAAVQDLMRVMDVNIQDELTSMLAYAGMLLLPVTKSHCTVHHWDW